MSLIHQQLSTAKAPTASVSTPPPPPQISILPPPSAHTDLHPHSPVTACSLEELVQPTTKRSNWALRSIAALAVAVGLYTVFSKHDKTPTVVSSEPAQTPVIAQTKPMVAEPKPVLVAKAPSIVVPPKQVDVVTPLALSLGSLPGVRTRVENERITIIFEESLFSRNYILSEQGKEMLTNIGRAIEPLSDQVDLAINGHTDNDPVPANREYKSNEELGLFRANTVAEFLSAQFALPAAMFSVHGFGEKDAPFPNDTNLNRTRNRTVTLTVTPSSKDETTL